MIDTTEDMRDKSEGERQKECKKTEESSKHLGIITHLSEILERKVERRKSSRRDTKYALFKMLFFKDNNNKVLAVFPKMFGQLFFCIFGT